jgi:hypothetical protein
MTCSSLSRTSSSLVSNSLLDSTLPPSRHKLYPPPSPGPAFLCIILVSDAPRPGCTIRKALIIPVLSPRCCRDDKISTFGYILLFYPGKSQFGIQDSGFRTVVGHSMSKSFSSLSSSYLLIHMSLRLSAGMSLNLLRI